MSVGSSSPAGGAFESSSRCTSVSSSSMSTEDSRTSLLWCISSSITISGISVAAVSSFFGDATVVAVVMDVAVGSTVSITTTTVGVVSLSWTFRTLSVVIASSVGWLFAGVVALITLCSTPPTESSPGSEPISQCGVASNSWKGILWTVTGSVVVILSTTLVSGLTVNSGTLESSSNGNIDGGGGSGSTSTGMDASGCNRSSGGMIGDSLLLSLLSSCNGSFASAPVMGAPFFSVESTTAISSTTSLVAMWLWWWLWSTVISGSGSVGWNIVVVVGRCCCTWELPVSSECNGNVVVRGYCDLSSSFSVVGVMDAGNISVVVVLLWNGVVVVVTDGAAFSLFFTKTTASLSSSSSSSIG